MHKTSHSKNKNKFNKNLINCCVIELMPFHRYLQKTLHFKVSPMTKPTSAICVSHRIALSHQMGKTSFAYRRKNKPKRVATGVVQHTIYPLHHRCDQSHTTDFFIYNKQQCRHRVTAAHQNHPKIQQSNLHKIFMHFVLSNN